MQQNKKQLGNFIFNCAITFSNNNEMPFYARCGCYSGNPEDAADASKSFYGK